MGTVNQVNTSMAASSPYILKTLQVKTLSLLYKRVREKEWQPNTETRQAVLDSLNGKMYTADEWFDSYEKKAT